MARRVSSKSQDSVGSEGISKLAGKWGGGSEAAVGGNANWADVDGHLMYTLAVVIGNRRGAVMYGVDRQGVGLTVCVWLGGEKVLNKWYNPAKGGIETLHSDIEAFLSDLEVYLG